MNYPAKKILLVASIVTLLALLVSGCDTESQGGIDQPVELAPADVEIDVSAVEEEVSGVDPEDIPSQEERNAILDRVNPGGPILRSGSEEEIGEGPEPGTESNREH